MLILVACITYKKYRYCSRRPGHAAESIGPVDQHLLYKREHVYQGTVDDEQ